ncbi:MAG: type II secretion system protein M [Deltaproteobacteria bacterium]|nr:type II secretion system protein M [Deltaproteobacteria bacterium]
MSELRRRLEQMLERLSPRERLLLGGAVTVTLLVLLWLVASTLGERRQLLGAQIAASERDLAEMVTLRDRYAHLRAERDAIQQRLAAGGMDFSLFSHLEGVSREALRPERIAAMNPSTRAVSDELQEEDVEMRLSAVSLRDVVTLLYRVEKTDLPLLVSRLQMKKRFDQPYVFDATLVVGRLRTTTAAPR